MRITFIGTSHGVPEPGRRCSSAMIEINRRIYFIDMGTPVVDELVTRGIPVDSVKGIFVTHMHGDHTNGLIQFVDLMNWYFKTADPLILLPEEGAAGAIKNWIEANGTQLRETRFGIINEGVTYDDGFLRMTAFRTKHCRTSYAYMLEAEGKNIFFSGDLAGPEKDFPQAAIDTPADLMVCEAAHFPPEAYLPVFRQCNIKQIIINHHAPRNMPGILVIAREMDPVPVRPAFDGLEIEL